MICRDEVRGIFLMAISQILFVAGWSGIKYIGEDMPLFEVVFFRSLMSVIILAPMAHIRLGTFRGENWRMIFVRSFFGYIGMVLIFYAITKMDMGNAVTLFNMLPIFVALLAPFFLKEKFRGLQFVFIVAAFGGIAMIIRPGADTMSLPAVLALVGGFCGAIAMMALRKLGSSDSPVLVTFYFTAFGTIVSLPVAAMDFIWPSALQWVLLVLIGIAVTFGQVLLAKAYKHGKAATIAPFGYLFVVGSYITGMLLFGEFPDAYSLTGAAITVACGIMIMLTAPKGDCVPGSTPGARA